MKQPQQAGNSLTFPSTTNLPMKKSHLILVSLLAVVPAISQERARVFDNFDTSRGVTVYNPNFVPVASKTKAASSKLTRSGKSLVKKTSQVQPAAVSRMGVSEGLADRELFNPASINAPKLNMNSSSGMKGFTTGNLVYDSYIVDSSRRYNIDPLLIYAQMHQESSFKLKALSYKGASGLMQLMPATARRLGVTNIYDPRQNIEGGVKYMRMLLNMFGGDVTLALAGYNAGEGAVMKYGNNIPPYNETREYVRRISARYASISGGAASMRVPNINSKEVDRLVKVEKKPLTVEQNAVAIRLPDGRMRLVNQ